MVGDSSATAAIEAGLADALAPVVGTPVEAAHSRGPGSLPVNGLVGAHDHQHGHGPGRRICTKSAAQAIRQLVHDDEVGMDLGHQLRDFAGSIGLEYLVVLLENRPQEAPEGAVFIYNQDPFHGGDATHLRIQNGTGSVPFTGGQQQKIRLRESSA